MLCCAVSRGLNKLYIANIVDVCVTFIGFSWHSRMFIIYLLNSSTVWSSNTRTQFLSLLSVQNKIKRTEMKTSLCLTTNDCVLLAMTGIMICRLAGKLSAAVRRFGIGVDNEGKWATGFYNVAFYISASSSWVIQDTGCKHLNLIHI